MGNWLRNLFRHKETAESTNNLPPAEDFEDDDPEEEALDELEIEQASLPHMLGLFPYGEDNKYEIVRSPVDLAELDRLREQIEAEAAAREAQTKPSKK